MSKVFNVTGDCKPDWHYMVKLDKRLAAIKKMIDDGAYFTINRSRQYGKTTTLKALSRYLQNDYCVVMFDFQRFGTGEFADENSFAVAFAEYFLEEFQSSIEAQSDTLKKILYSLEEALSLDTGMFRLRKLFSFLREICMHTDRPIVLMIDEVDSATNNQVFLDFLAQLRAAYLDRDVRPTFQSVILAGVHDVKNLRRKLRPEDSHKMNSPWNIAADFKVEMSFFKKEIAAMLKDYEDDHHTGMDIDRMAGLIYDYTSGYPYLVSRLCKYLDEDICTQENSLGETYGWTERGFHEAVKRILSEQSTLFESLTEKIVTYPDLSEMLRNLLFAGKTISYNYYEPSTNIATMFGFVKNQDGVLAIANRIFETWLYNYFLASVQMQSESIYNDAVLNKSRFIQNGHLNMRHILERFVEHFHDIFGERDQKFIEEEARKYFLLYLRPIINGVGNYYIEARTRDMRRTDVIVDYLGEQFVIELKIWHGDEYNRRGEQQLIGYLEDYHAEVGYMVSFSFNKKKEIGVSEIKIGEKTLIEAVV